MLTKTERFDWLRGLDISQIRALACQRGLEDWRLGMPSKLIPELAEIEDINVPVVC